MSEFPEEVLVLIVIIIIFLSLFPIRLIDNIYWMTMYSFLCSTLLVSYMTSPTYLLDIYVIHFPSNFHCIVYICVHDMLVIINIFSVEWYAILISLCYHYYSNTD